MGDLPSSHSSRTAHLVAPEDSPSRDQRREAVAAPPCLCPDGFPRARCPGRLCSWHQVPSAAPRETPGLASVPSSRLLSSRAPGRRPSRPEPGVSSCPSGCSGSGPPGLRASPSLGLQSSAFQPSFCPKGLSWDPRSLLASLCVSAPRALSCASSPWTPALGSPLPF